METRAGGFNLTAKAQFWIGAERARAVLRLSLLVSVVMIARPKSFFWFGVLGVFLEQTCVDDCMLSMP
jgi:hypothetical protein